MKLIKSTPIYIGLVVIACSLFVACSQEETIENEGINLIINNAQTENNRNSYGGCGDIACDENYVFPTGFGGEVHVIEYDSSLTMEEIHCIRHAYFVCYTDLKISIFDPSGSDYVEAWVRETWHPDDDLDVTICNDPRLAGSNCED